MPGQNPERGSAMVSVAKFIGKSLLRFGGLIAKK
jgi:hypothetical protein